MTESQFTRNIAIPALQSLLGGTWVKISGGMYQESGIPDILGWVGGRGFAIEVKLPTNKKGCSKKQIEFIKRLRKEKVVATVIWCEEDIYRLFKKSKKTGLYRAEIEEPRYDY